VISQACDTCKDANMDTCAVRPRPWLSPESSARESEIIASLPGASLDDVDGRLHALVKRNREIHEVDCINLNPATNVMNPRAEAVMAAGLGSRPSLGNPGEKYEMGLEAMEEIEVLAASLVRRLFGCRFAELRVASGAMANLYAFMSTCEPGDSIIVPPPSIGGHVTHNVEGAAGLYRLDIHEGPIDASRHTYDLDALAEQAHRVHPRLITIGTSLNLMAHPVSAIREIADEVGASVLFDAAHACGMLAGGAWPMPLDEGAHLMTMSTYKSLGGPPSGLVLTNDEELAEKIDSIAYPGLTANFDAGCTAALAITMLDWLEYGEQYTAEMMATSRALAEALIGLGMPVHQTEAGPTTSHQFAIDAERWGGGMAGSQILRRANLLACEIGLPGQSSAGGSGGRTGVRLGTPEIVRWGMTTTDMPELAAIIADALAAGADPATLLDRTARLRGRFSELHYVRS